MFIYFIKKSKKAKRKTNTVFKYIPTITINNKSNKEKNSRFDLTEQERYQLKIDNDSSCISSCRTPGFCKKDCILN